MVGGVTENCQKLAAALYGSAITTIVPVSSTRVAEMVKLLENTFRAVNIALVNELALMCDRMNIDVWEVVDAARTKPFGFMAFYPGPGLGGHCIPIDPFYLSWKAKQSGFDPRFIELAGHINGAMPEYVVSKVAEALNTKRKAINGANILIAGVAYKRDIDDMRESPALDVMGLLRDKGANVSYVDPYVPEVHAQRMVRPRRHQAARIRRPSPSAATTASSSSPITRRSTTTRWSREADLIVDTRNAIHKAGGTRLQTGCAASSGSDWSASSPASGSLYDARYHGNFCSGRRYCSCCMSTRAIRCCSRCGRRSVRARLRRRFNPS